MKLLKSLKVRGQYGYNHLAHMLIVLVLLSIVGGAGIVVAKRQPPKDNVPPADVVATPEAVTKTETASKTVSWQFVDNAWTPSKTPPKCSTPLLKISPVSLSQATSILYPGQVRGGNYKAHGGIRFDNTTDNKITVKLPVDATLVSGSRYIENGDTQYLLDFVSECGIAVRFDHLLTLSDSMQKLVDANLSEAKTDDSRGTNFPKDLAFKSGLPIANAIGSSHPPRNVGFDFGVYDYRQPNEASKVAGFNPAGSSPSLANYGICWLTELPKADAAKALSLPAGDQQQGKNSDYCK